MPARKLILDYVYEHEASSYPSALLLTQPLDAGKVEDYSWARALDEARRMATHLRRIGLAQGAHIAILSKNCAHFIIAELAIWIAGGTTVALFPNDHTDTVRFVLDHSDAKLLFVGKLDNWDKQRDAVPHRMPCIALPLAPDTGFEGWDDIIASSAPMEGRPTRAPGDLAMLIYTSGSTGQPKGAMHTFGGITRAAEGIIQTVFAPLGADDIRMFSYLPLAHVYERSGLECVALVRGGVRIYFAESAATFVADLIRARPTVFYSVPRLWLKFQRGVFAKIAPAKLDILLAIPLVRKIVGRKILAALGLDCVRLAASASAPIPAEVIAWYRRLGLNLLEGYGMTEDFGYSHASSKRFNAPGYVGVPYENVEVRLTNTGEILVKSPGQCVGYYKRSDLDAESFTSDGFFRTGDVGEWGANQLLKLTGRIKEIFKTAGGEYIAPAPIENMLDEHRMIELSMVSGVGRESAFAMVVLVEELRDKLDDPDVKREVEAELTQLMNKVNHVLLPRERLHMLVALTEPWTIENGCLTPTMKIKRKRIESLVEDKLDAWYSAGARVIWA